MATLQSWRKAYGAIKDTTKVGLAHVNSDFAVSQFSILFFLLLVVAFEFYLIVFFSFLNDEIAFVV